MSTKYKTLKQFSDDRKLAFGIVGPEDHVRNTKNLYRRRVVRVGKIQGLPAVQFTNRDVAVHIDTHFMEMECTPAELKRAKFLQPIPTTIYI